MTHILPVTKRVRLKGHDPLSRTTIHGWPAILFGLVFLIPGIPTLSIGMGWIDYPKHSTHAPLWVIGFCGGLFIGGGLWLAIHGLRGLRRTWNREHGMRQLPASPWLWDYPWQAQGTTDNKLKSAIGSLLTLIIFQCNSCTI